MHSLNTIPCGNPSSLFGVQWLGCCWRLTSASATRLVQRGSGRAAVKLLATQSQVPASLPLSRPSSHKAVPVECWQHAVMLVHLYYVHIIYHRKHTKRKCGKMRERKSNGKASVDSNKFDEWWWVSTEPEDIMYSMTSPATWLVLQLFWNNQDKSQQMLTFSLGSVTCKLKLQGN